MKSIRRMHEQAAQHREKYETYKDSSDDWLRRKVHLDLDRWLMEHREAAIILITEALDREIQQAAKAKPFQTATKSVSWWRRITVRP